MFILISVLFVTARAVLDANRVKPPAWKSITCSDSHTLTSALWYTMNTQRGWGEPLHHIQWLKYTDTNSLINADISTLINPQWKKPWRSCRKWVRCNLSWITPCSRKIDALSQYRLSFTNRLSRHTAILKMLEKPMTSLPVVQEQSLDISWCLPRKNYKVIFE